MSNSDSLLRAGIIRLAHEHPEFRDDLLPLVKSSALTPTQVAQSYIAAVSSLTQAAKLMDQVQEHLDRAWSMADAIGTGVGSKAMAVRQAGTDLRNSILDLKGVVTKRR